MWRVSSNKHGLEKLLLLSKKRRAYGVRSLSQEIQPGARTRRLSCAVNSKATSHAGPRKSMAAHMNKGDIYTVGEAENVHPLMFEVDSIFILENRTLYMKLLEIFQMLCSLYLSLYLTNFLVISLKTKFAVYYTIFSIGSIVVLLMIMSFTQFHSNVLFSVTSLQNGATEWICQQDDIKNKTLPKLRDELINIIDTDNFGQEISDLYTLVNENGKDGVDIKDFRNLLFTLNIQLNSEETQCLFRVLNITGTGLIGIRELKELLRPDSSFLSKDVEKTDRFSGSEASSQNSNKRETLLSVQSLGAPSERNINISPHLETKTLTKESGMSGVSEDNGDEEEVRHFESEDANVYNFKDNVGIHDGSCLSDADGL
mmetsp:Transcript_9237/g.17231  ORF Transcript_9237/g.17231 Transcript_9237/m.17231 type:complete len:371 (+) Transcript_9237:126-1238(+)